MRCAAHDENDGYCPKYMISKNENSGALLEKKDAPGCAEGGVAAHPEITVGIGSKIRDIRSRSGLGSLIDSAHKLGFNKNTIASYENGLSLPDIDFLVVFAAKTGADLNELVRLRLAASRYATVRALVETSIDVKPAPVAEEPPTRSPGEVEFQRGKDWSMLEALLRICEDRLGREVSPETLDKIADIVKSWESATDLRQDLVARMERVKAGVALLRSE